MEEGEMRVEPSGRGLMGERMEFGDVCDVGRKEMEIMSEEERIRRNFELLRG